MNENLLSILYTLVAMLTLIPAFYVLIANRKDAGNQAAAVLFTILAFNSIALAGMASVYSLAEARPWLVIFIVTTYMIGPALYIASVAVLRPAWLRHWWLYGPIALSLLVPPVVVLADLSGLAARIFPQPLLVTLPDPQVYSGGLVPLADLTDGAFDFVLRGLFQYAFPALAVICPMLVVLIRDWKRDPPNSGLAALFLIAAIPAALAPTALKDVIGPALNPAAASLALFSVFVLTFLRRAGVPWSLSTIRRTLNDWPIFAKLVLVVVTVLIPSVAIISLVTSSIVRSNITSQIGSNFNAIARLEARSIAESLRAQAANLERLSLSPALRESLAVRSQETGRLSPSQVRSWLNRQESDWIQTSLSSDPALASGYLPSIATLQEFQANFPDFTYLQLTDFNGGLVSASGTPRHYDYSNAGWWRAAYSEGAGRLYVSVPLRDLETGSRYVQIAIPVRVGEDRRVAGVLMGHYDLMGLIESLAATQIGREGRSDLFTPGGVLVPLRASPAQVIAGAVRIVDLDWDDLLADPSPWRVMPYEGVSSIVSWATVGEQLSGSATAESIAWRVTIHQPVTEALQAVAAAQRASILTTLITTLAGFGIAFALARFMTRPITELTAVAEQVLDGDLHVRADVLGQDEIGVLAETFNMMTEQVSSLVTDLEKQVAERTGDLERQTQKLQAAAQVGQGVISILNTEELMQTTVEVIRERFDLYYVGLFLVDENREWAVLRHGTGSAGERMQARGHRIRVGQGMIGWSVQNSLPRVAGEVSEDAVRLVTAELPETRSEAAIPMRARGQTIGALTVQSTRPNEFDPATVNILQTLTDQVGIAITNAGLMEQNQAALADSQKALETVRRTYQQITRAAWSDTTQRRQWQLVATPTGVAWQQEDEGHGPVDDPAQEVVVPILVRDHSVGTIRLRRDDPEAEWTDSERRYIDSIVGQLGQALDSARLFQDTQTRSVQLQVSSEIGRVASSILQLDELLPAAVNLIGDSFSLYYVGIFLVDESGEWAVLRAGTGEAGDRQLAAGHRLRVGGDSMIGHCVATGEARIALDIGEEAIHFDNPELPETRSEMVLPLVSGGEALGALTIQSTTSAAFTRNDLTVFQTMANQLATAVRNASLYQQTQQAMLIAEEQRRIADALLKSAVRFAGTQETDVIFDIIVKEIDEQIRPDQVNILLWLESTEEFFVARRVSPGDPEDDYREGQRIHRSARPDLFEIFSTKERQYLPEVRDDGLTHEQYRVPLLLANTAIGVMEVFHTAHDAHIREEDRAVIDGVIQQAAVAIQSARAFLQTQDALARTDALYRVGQAAIGMGSLPELLQSVTDTIAETMPADHVALCTFDLGNRSITHYIENGVPAGQAEKPAFESLMDGLAGWVVRERKPAVSPKGRRDPRESEVAHKLRTASGMGGRIVVPLLVRGEVLGTITATNDMNHIDFTNEDADLVMAMATQTAVAIQNSALFAETQLTAQNERLLNEIGSQLIQSLDFETILRTAVEEIGQLPNITGVTLTVGETEGPNGDGSA